MQIRISIIAGIALNGLLAERHPFIAPSFRPFIAFEGCSSRTEIQLDVKYIYIYIRSDEDERKVCLEEKSNFFNEEELNRIDCFSHLTRRDSLFLSRFPAINSRLLSENIRVRNILSVLSYCAL